MSSGSWTGSCLVTWRFESDEGYNTSTALKWLARLRRYLFHVSARLLSPRIIFIYVLYTVWECLVSQTICVARVVKIQTTVSMLVFIS